VRPWNVAEVQAFLRAVKGDRLYAPFLPSLTDPLPQDGFYVLRHACDSITPEAGGSS